MGERPELGPAEYVCYAVVKQMEVRGGELPETSFNKLCALVYDEVDSEEVPLPLRWYQYGYEVERRALDGSFLRRRRRTDWGNHGYQMTLREVSEPVFNIAEDLKTEIDAAAARLAEQFPTGNSTDIKRYSYQQQAPNEFVQVMDRFRSVLDTLDVEQTGDRDDHVAGVDVSFSDLTRDADDTDDGQPPSADVDDATLNGYLRELAATFPADTYDRMDSQFHEWRLLSKQMIRYGEYAELRNFQKAFWNAFSKAELRMHHNVNIPMWRLSTWRGARSEAIESFEEVLASKRAVIKKRREPTRHLDSVSEEYDAAVERVNRQLEQ